MIWLSQFMAGRNLRAAFFFLTVLSFPAAHLPCAAAAEPARLPLGLETFDTAWKIIHDSHWDTTFNGVNWVGLKDELRPRAEKAVDVDELREVINEMLGRLGQSHMALIPHDAADAFDPVKVAAAKEDETGPAIDKAPEVHGETPGDTSGDLGFEVRLFEGQLLIVRVDPSGPAAAGGVRPGWFLQAIGKANIHAELTKLPANLPPRRAQVLAWTMARAHLLGRPESRVEVEFADSAGRPVKLKLTRRREPGESVKFAFLPRMTVRLESRRVEGQGVSAGCIWFNTWMIPVARQFDQAVDEFRAADGIVLDLRGNIGGIGGMVMGFAGHFLREKLSLGTMKTRDNNLTFYANPRWVNPDGERVEPYAGPVAILTDGLSVSAAEIFAGGMQDLGRARVFGATSAGQALPAIWDRLPNGDVLYHAFADFITPSGVRLEARGVIPDEPVPLRREELLAGRDAPMEAALRWIAREKVRGTDRQQLKP